MAKYVKKDGRAMVPANADANVSVGRPKKLEDYDKEILEGVLTKYTEAPLLPIIESLITAGKPIKGFSKELDPEYFIRQFIQIGKTASKTYDRILAMEKAARLMGYMTPENRSSQGVNIKFNLHKPADAQIVDAEFISE